MPGIQGGDPYFSLYAESDWILLSSKGVGGGYGYLRFHTRQTHSILDVIEIQVVEYPMPLRLLLLDALAL